jgi:NAD(P)-dependent dehydrogenase (short-subunit alcohol dehydrogenase family)
VTRRLVTPQPWRRRRRGEARKQAETLGRGPGWESEEAARLPLGRLVTAEEAARLTVFLLGEASAPMSGALIDLEQQMSGAIG